MSSFPAEVQNATIHCEAFCNMLMIIEVVKTYFFTEVVMTLSQRPFDTDNEKITIHLPNCNINSSFFPIIAETVIISSKQDYQTQYSWVSLGLCLGGVKILLIIISYFNGFLKISKR